MMTNAEKGYLRSIMRKRDPRSDKDIAEDVGCSIATVRKYRKVFAKGNDNGS